MRLRNADRRIPLAIGTAALTLGALVTVSSPASALTGSVLVTATSLSTSGNKNVTAACPNGTAPVGAGGSIIDGGGNVLVTDVVPDLVLDQVMVQGGENGPFAGSWKVRAYAICAPSIGLGLNLKRVGASNNGTSDDYHSATATCDPGEKLYGTGFSLNNANGNAFIDDLVPAAGLGSVQVGAYENAGFTGLWDLDAIGICGVDNGQTLTSAASAFSATTPKTTATADCVTGTAIGGGAMLVGATGDVLIDEWHPNPAQSRFTTTAQANAGFAGSWNLTTYLICL